MSVILKGVEMPKNCAECPCKYFTEGAYFDFCQVTNTEIKEETSILGNCPLKSVEGLLKEIESRKDIYKPENEDKSDDTPIDYGTRRGLSIAIKIIKEYCGMEEKS